MIGGAFGATFAAAASPQVRNTVRGQGFRSNSKVLASFVGRGDHQGALDYFGFEGTYNPNKPAGEGYIESGEYFGSTDPLTGEISYGNLAFDSYDILRGVAAKEYFHSSRVLSGTPLATQDAPFIKNGKYFPEEALGFEYAYRNQGFYPKSTINYISNIESYRAQSINVLNASFNNKWWHFLYKIPRRY